MSELSKEELQNLADGGDGNACYEYAGEVEWEAVELSFKDDFDRDEIANERYNELTKQAFTYYLKAAEAGIPKAMSRAGSYYISEGFFDHDLNKAVYWYQKGADGGDKDACYNLARCYRYGKGVQEDTKKAFELYKRAAEGKSGYALYSLGECYYYGIGTEKNLNKAFGYFKESADNNCFDAEYMLAECYFNGEGTEKDIFKAVKYYKSSAEEHFNTLAEYKLGLLYENGTGVEKDLNKAVRLFHSASRDNYLPAIVKCADSYFNDRLFEDAYEYYERAAVMGDAYAQYMMGEFNWYGYHKVPYQVYGGIRRNVNESVRWWFLSAGQGYEKAKEKLKEANKYK